ncbi:Nucleic acid-binding OB-fold [Penicillium chermesinum]|nr:Nucleic acid-binding OB-fold [Penicillium chermesinum]
MDNFNSYGGQSGGGGFMPGETNSPSGGKTGDRDNKTLRPVTIKQILDASSPYPEAPYQIDGADVANVLFIGQVRNISAQSTNVTYKIDDGTGEVEVKKWVDSAMADSMDTDEGTKGPGDGKNEVKLNGHARVFGAIKSFGNKRYIGAHSVRPMTDINELNCHLLEATMVHLFFTRGPPGGASGGNAQGGDAVMGGADDYGAGQNKALGHMTPLAKKIYNVLKTEPQDDTGLHLQQIATKLNVPATDVARAGEELMGAGVIFSTMDEQTWAILEYE